MLPVLFQIRVKLCLGSFDENVILGRDCLERKFLALFIAKIALDIFALILSM